MGSKHVGFHYSIAWGNPNTNPPKGKPRVIAEMFETIEQRKQRVDGGDGYFPNELAAFHTLGDGYGCCISSVSTPRHMLPKETLAEIRLKRIKRRISKKYPLLADIFIKEAIEKNPSYYAGETDPKIKKAHDEAIRDEEALYQRFLKAIQGEEQYGKS